MSDAKLRCFSMCFLICFIPQYELVTSSLLIGNRVYWLKFAVTDLGFLDHGRNKLFGRQKNMGCCTYSFVDGTNGYQVVQDEQYLNSSPYSIMA